MPLFFFYLISRALDIYLGIWAVNHLFHTNIAYNWKNILAAYFIIAIVDSNPWAGWNNFKNKED